jgi:hypothetical protein
VSEQHSEPTSGETGSIGTGPAAPDMSQPKEPVTATAPIESPHLALDQEGTSKPDAPRETTKVELPKAEVTGVETTRVDATRTEPPPIPGKLLVMSPGDRAWNGQDAAEKSEAAGEASSGKRRMSAMAAAVALATIAGAVGGALATTGLGYLMAGNRAIANASALESQVARIDADIVALKASVEHTSKMGMSQFNKTSDRLDKVEKAQAEPAVKLARLSEAVDKLRAQPAPAAVAPAATAVAPAAKEVTGSIAPAAAAATTPVPLPAPKPEIARLPTVDGWVIRDVGRGGALIESRRGIFEVYAGDSIPGLGSIDAIRRQDGKWVVVTSKGLIVAR